MRRRFASHVATKAYGGRASSIPDSGSAPSPASRRRIVTVVLEVYPRLRSMIRAATLGKDMAKNILIFSDGTGQAGGLRPDQRLSNIYKLYRATRPGPDSGIDPAAQVAYYDPGLGTASADGGIQLSFLDKILGVLGLITGLGITDNIIDCYVAILKSYEPGDRICLFGFSRGAYTARCVAGVLRLCGIPTHDGKGQPLPTDGPALRRIAREAVAGVYERRFSTNENDRVSAQEAAATQFREKYGSHGETTEVSNVAPEFIGVFDSVAALGASGVRLLGLVVFVAIVVAAMSAFAGRIAEVLAPVLSPWWVAFGVFIISSAWLVKKLSSGRWKGRSYDRSLDPRTGYARHARAIDETRADFEVLPWGHSEDVAKQQKNRPNAEWLIQLWFAGNHSDIGGSYMEDESRLSDIALDWMVGELKTCVPLVIIDGTKLNLWPSCDGIQHCEVQYSAEQWWRPTWPSRPRSVPVDAALHPTVLERFALKQVPHCRHVGPYRPTALRNHREVARYYAHS